MAEQKNKKDDSLTYKGRPLVRSGNTIYYGFPGDKYVALLQIVSNETFNEMELGNKVTVQIMATDPEVRTKDRIIKKTEKNGLYNALNIALSGWSGLWRKKSKWEKKSG